MAKGARVARKSAPDQSKIGWSVNEPRNVSVEMKDFSSARKYYEEALKLEPNGEYAPEAKQALHKLKKK